MSSDSTISSCGKRKGPTHSYVPGVHLPPIVMTGTNTMTSSHHWTMPSASGLELPGFRRAARPCLAWAVCDCDFSMLSPPSHLAGSSAPRLAEPVSSAHAASVSDSEALDSAPAKDASATKALRQAKPLVPEHKARAEVISKEVQYSCSENARGFQNLHGLVCLDRLVIAFWAAYGDRMNDPLQNPGSLRIENNRSCQVAYTFFKLSECMEEGVTESQILDWEMFGMHILQACVKADTSIEDPYRPLAQVCVLNPFRYHLWLYLNFEFEELEPI